jgi:hypothetical protein
MKTVERQTRYAFAFDRRTFDVTRTVQAGSTAVGIGEALDLITAGTDHAWLLRDAYIIIHYSPRKPEPVIREPRTGDVYRAGAPGGTDNAFRTRERTQREQPDSIPADIPVEVPEEYPAPVSNYRNPDLYTAMSRSLPRVAVKTNILYDAAALTGNLGVEIGLDRRSTLELAGSWNQRNHEGHRNGNRKLNHGIARAEYRRWFCERYNGSFVGVHAFLAKYNVGGIEIPTLFEKEFRYEGNGVGVGLTSGYHWAAAKRWGVDFYAGVGVVRLDYRRFPCALCGTEIERRTRYWFGPTRAGVSVVFLIR